MRSQQPIFWWLVFVAHLAAAGGWWWIMPAGFPWAHPRFWANAGFPSVVAAVALVGISGLLLNRAKQVQFAATLLAGLWTAAGLAALAIFPSSSKMPALLALAVAALLCLRWRAVCRFAELPRARNAESEGSPSTPLAHRSSAITMALAALLGMLLGAASLWTQRGPAADTAPLAEKLPPLPTVDRTADGSAYPSVQLCDRLSVQPATGQLLCRRGPLSLEIAPLLTFQSRSPDRFWTLLAKPADRIGPSRKLLGRQRRENGMSLYYSTDGDELLDIDCTPHSGVVDVTAYCTLPREVFSHLNGFTDLTIYGHQRLALRFSPCPAVTIDVLPSDYPVGRPRRFGYLSAAGEFCVVEAASGEKGPFRRLAAGPLKRGDPLTITFCDAEMPVCSVTLLDWSAQCSTQLSPTAGWGVPVNAIEFARDGNSQAAAASIWITLAGTSIGRGFDSVGHAAGVYRNRLRIENADGR